jgi:hypothetical protein
MFQRIILGLVILSALVGESNLVEISVNKVNDLCNSSASCDMMSSVTKLERIRPNKKKYNSKSLLLRKKINDYFLDDWKVSRCSDFFRNLVYLFLIFFIMAISVKRKYFIIFKSDSSPPCVARS